MKKPAFFILFFISFYSVYASHTVTIENLCSIELPGKPEYSKQDSVSLYVYTDPATKFIYKIIVTKLSSKTTKDLSENDLYDFYQEYGNSFVKKNKGDFAQFQTYWIDDLAGQELMFEKNRNPMGTQPEYCYVKYILFNKKLITYFISGYKRDKRAVENTRDEYFGTFNLFGHSKPVPPTDITDDVANEEPNPEEEIPDDTISYDQPETSTPDFYESYNESRMRAYQQEEENKAFRHTLMIAFFAFIIFVGIILGLLLLRYFINRSNKDHNDTHEPH